MRGPIRPGRPGRWLGSAAVAGALVVGTLAFSAPAASAAPAPDCKTVTSTLTNHPDNGHSGIWAEDSGTRTVKVCVVQPEVLARVAVTGAHFHAVVTDEGTFVTRGGDHLSPNKGVKLLANVHGTWNGGFVADFEAPAPTAPGVWPNFDASTLQGKTFNGTDGPKTGEWVKSLWKQAELKVSPGGWTDNYSWTYRTCNEQWIDAENNKDGQGPLAGDITGYSIKPCYGNPSFVAQCDGTVLVTLTNAAPSDTAKAFYVVTGLDTTKYPKGVVVVAGGEPGKVTVTATPNDSGNVIVKYLKHRDEWVTKVFHYVKPNCATPTPTPTATVTTTPPNTLPVTGFPTGYVAGGGAALLAFGGVLLVVGLRRRRTEFTA